MPFPVRRRPSRRVLFPSTASRQSDPDLISTTMSAQTETSSGADPRDRDPTAAADDDDLDAQFIVPLHRKIPFAARPDAPPLFASPPPLRDALSTETSVLQDRTIQECLPHLASTETHGGAGFNSFGLPHLDRENHVEFLQASLELLPAGWVAADASRPWMLYWALTGLGLLGEDIGGYRERVIQTLTPLQNPDGGFGGGHGQMSHCASSYAAVLSLLMVGGDEALKSINRKTLWKWLGDLKQPDGGFQLCIGGEEDVRGAYCAMVMICLLNLPLVLPATSPARKSPDDTFLTNLPEYLSRCQTYEGGISDSPDTEAHGAFAFCALACLCILGPADQMLPTYLDIPALTAWLSARQYAPEGGFSGRANKLVDGCYSHWVGGCWPLLEAALNGPQSERAPHSVVGSLYSREGLGRYILCCCQGKRGGLRDKPSKSPDSYHTCYVLAGLSSAQHYWSYTSPTAALASSPLDASFHWQSRREIPAPEGSEEQLVFDDEDRVDALHPIFAIPPRCVEEARTFFGGMVGF